MLIIDKIHKEMHKTNSLVCVGLDPILNLMPKKLLVNFPNEEKRIFSFLITVVDATSEFSCAYKIQKAFFDQYNFGHRLLKKTVLFIKKNFPEKALIIDCKIGDVEHTLKAYTQNIFQNIGADGIVVNPFMGNDVYNIFTQYPDKLFVVLVRTSNKGAQLFQDLLLANKEKLWMHILKSLSERWEDTRNIIPVLSFTRKSDYCSIRKVIPDEMPIFWAGYGAQGKCIKGIKYLIDKNGYGIIVNSSRGILYSNYEKYCKWEYAVYNNAMIMKNALNQLKID